MQRKYLVALLAIIALGAFLRFWRITEIPLGLYPDEAMNGNNALEVLATGQFKVFYPENSGREGLFINLQAISVAAFGAKPWALRIVSSLIGTLTIFGVYLVAKELFGNYELRIRNYGGESSSPNSLFVILHSECIALLAAFFLATSYWHLNFSRIGFRAIILPSAASFGIYFLLRGLRTGKRAALILAGIVGGLGFYTYIAYRFMIFVAAVPLIRYWRQWRDGKKHSLQEREGPEEQNRLATPHAIVLFLSITFMVALPIGVYFLRHPQDFSSRADDVSVFSMPSPFKELALSTLKTAGMFFVAGDCNWRHNYACQPQLHPLVAALFAGGLMVALGALILRRKERVFSAALLLSWLIFMMLPEILTHEGIPHALRAIGMIPPVMILASWGATTLGSFVLGLLEKQKQAAPGYAAQLSRIQRELVFLFLLALLLIPLATYQTYFFSWADNKRTYDAFDTGSWHLGKFLARLDPSIKKYVAVNQSGKLARGVPISAQTVMFATDTFREEGQKKANLVYLAGPDIVSGIARPRGSKTLIAVLNPKDLALVHEIMRRYPEFKEWIPGDFLVLQNYANPSQ